MCNDASTDMLATRKWLLDSVCPYWRARVIDPKGGYFENLDQNGEPISSPLRHLLVQARLTYVFSHAYVLSGDERMRDAAEHGAARLRAWPRQFDNGFARATLRSGVVVDVACDAYDHAFVIFAGAWHYRATGDKRALLWAEEAFSFMQRSLSDSVGAGFFEEYPNADRLPRRQNPHMHLLEATLAMYSATRSEQWLDASRDIVALFRERLFDQETGSVGEYFDRAWQPAAGAAGMRREPGHQFEWVWLLSEYAKASGDNSVMPTAGRLFDFGSTFGIDSEGAWAGVVLDAVTREGSVIEGTKLLWPQTEYVKACAALAERGVPGMRDQMLQHLHVIRARFMLHEASNWCNQRARNGVCLSSATPARVLYHLVLAVAEALRVQEAIEVRT